MIWLWYCFLFADPSLNLRTQKDRTVFTDQQMIILESAFQKNKHPDAQRRGLVAELCNLSTETVRIWYQNRRAKQKRVEEDELALLASKMVSFLQTFLTFSRTQVKIKKD